MAQARYDTAEPTASQEAHAVLAGTLSYMAPEILGGKPADAANDIWSLGVLLYEISAGALPFRGATSFELTGAILRDPPKPLPSHVSPALRAIILRCLAKEPGQRYRRTGEVRAALEAVFCDAKIPKTVGPLPDKRHPNAPRRISSSLIFKIAITLLLRVRSRPQALARGTSAGAVESPVLSRLLVKSFERDLRSPS
jgi:serine/threonine protein kinase